MKQAAVKNIAVLAYPGANSLDVTGPLQVFASASRYMANFAEREGLFCDVSYKTEVISPDGGAVTLAPGFDILTSRSIFDDLSDIDTLLIAGGDGFRELEQDQRFLEHLRKNFGQFRRFGSVCTGAFLLGAAGVLDGRKATTHWRYCREFETRFPEICVEADAIYIKDNTLYTSGGVTAGIDLGLAMIEEDCGPRISLAVAKEIVACKVRLGGQSQYSTQLEVSYDRNSSLSNLLQWVVANLDQDLSVEALAEHVAMSPRNFARVFVREIGITPAKYVERVRLEAARVLLEEAGTPFTQIAETCGFGHVETMRRVFLRHLKVGPREYQDRFRMIPDHGDRSAITSNL